MKQLIFFSLCLIISAVSSTAQQGSDYIIGRWRGTGNKMEVEIYKTGNEYKAKIIRFTDNEVANNALNTRWDTKNAGEILPPRKIIGSEVMQGLVYNAEADEWQHGRIYDFRSGRNWHVKASITKQGYLKVRGFWHFECFGQNMFFKKIS